MKFFLVLFLLIPSESFAECLTAAVLNEDADYEACRITLDGKETDHKIPESSCAAYCQLLAAKNMGATYQEFSRGKKITVKPGQRAPASD